MSRKHKKGPDSPAYEVGYKKPPKDTMFTKGRSGNPKGRPKGSKNFNTDFMEELLTTVEITEGGKRQLVTKQRALVKRMINGAINGDLRATDMVAKLTLSMADAEKDGQDAPISVEDRKIIKDYLKEQEHGDT